MTRLRQDHDVCQGCGKRGFFATGKCQGCRKTKCQWTGGKGCKIKFVPARGAVLCETHRAIMAKREVGA